MICFVVKMSFLFDFQTPLLAQVNTSESIFATQTRIKFLHLPCKADWKDID